MSEDDETFKGGDVNAAHRGAAVGTTVPADRRSQIGLRDFRVIAIQIEKLLFLYFNVHFDLTEILPARVREKMHALSPSYTRRFCGVCGGDPFLELLLFSSGSLVCHTVFCHVLKPVPL